MVAISCLSYNNQLKRHFYNYIKPSNPDKDDVPPTKISIMLFPIYNKQPYLIGSNCQNAHREKSKPQHEKRQTFFYGTVSLSFK